jgi:hypothetical protein
VPFGEDETPSGNVGDKVAVRWTSPPAGTHVWLLHIWAQHYGETTTVKVYAIAAPEGWADWDDTPLGDFFTKGDLLSTFTVAPDFDGYKLLYTGAHPANGFLLECTDGAWLHMHAMTFLHPTCSPYYI